MGLKLFVSIVLLVVSASGAAQVQPSAARMSHVSAGGGMDYWSGDWGSGNINRWGPSAWATLDAWHGFGINAEVHTLWFGGNDLASHYRYFVGEGGLFYMDRHWKSIQPFLKGELGFGSLSQPGNGTGQFHYTSNTWALGGGVEIRNTRRLWTRVDYTYDYFPNFHSSVTGQSHALNPRGLTFGETFRF